MYLLMCRSSRVCSTALWILGEYSSGVQEVMAAVEVIKAAIGPLPLLSTQGEAHTTGQLYEG
jgi:coatomer subunit beta